MEAAQGDKTGRRKNRAGAAGEEEEEERRSKWRGCKLSRLSSGYFDAFSSSVRRTTKIYVILLLATFRKLYEVQHHTRYRIYDVAVPALSQEPIISRAPADFLVLGGGAKAHFFFMLRFLILVPEKTFLLLKVVIAVYNEWCLGPRSLTGRAQHFSKT